MINNGVSVTGQHEQVWVTVNALVDRGVRELIAALSAYPSVRTLESCEGNDDSAWVCFDCGEEDWRALSEFVLGVIGPTLIADFGNRVELRVYITSSGFYRAEMTVCKAVISAVSETVKRLAINAKAA
jgi:hypothetical protein